MTSDAPAERPGIWRVITAWGFQLASTLFQVPAGLFGERVGACTALMCALVGCSVASFATGLMPEAPTAGITTLVLTRVLLGVARAEDRSGLA